MSVTPPPLTVAVAVAPAPPPPVMITAGGVVYPLPPKVTSITVTNPPVGGSAVAAAVVANEDTSIAQALDSFRQNQTDKVLGDSDPRK